MLVLDRLDRVREEAREDMLRLLGAAGAGDRQTALGHKSAEPPQIASFEC